MKKFTDIELLESLLKETNTQELEEIYKALICYSCGIENITPEIENILNDTINYFWDNDNITSIINEEIKNYFEKSIDN